jgi:hypothetical protein
MGPKWYYDGPMSKREGNAVVHTSLRMPRQLYRRLAAVKRSKPHMSMHALIIEAIAKELKAGKTGGPK